MGSRVMLGGTLRATLCEVERGLFHVNYRSEAVDWDVHELPLYQVGTSAADAQQRIEQRAQECGFDIVTWDHVLVDPAPRFRPTQDIPNLSDGLFVAVGK